MRETFFSSLNADELLDVTPPWRQILVAERPIDADSFPRVRLDVEIAPSIDAAPPHDRPSADLSATDPVERLPFGGRLGTVELVDGRHSRVFVARASVSLD